MSQRLLRRALAASLLYWAAFAALSPGCALADSGKPSQQDRWRDVGSAVLKDGRTQLLWTKEDNGGDIDWKDAASYCSGKRSGWRLPNIEELAAIFDAESAGTKCAEATCKVSPHFSLSGTWFWSSTQVGKDATDGDELAWGVGMVNGARTQSVRDADYGSRALCVRSPGRSTR